MSTASRILALRMWETASKYGEQLQMYRINTSVNATRGGLPAWGLEKWLATL